MAKSAITYEKVKNYIEGEHGKDCVLLSNKEEFEKEKIKQNKTGTRVILEIQCQCGKKFETCLNSFKENDKRHCNDCGLLTRQSNIDKNKIIKETKICNRCGDELPLNEKYFRLKKLRGKYIYYYICKQCEIELRFSNEVHIKDNRTREKQCIECDRILPSTTEYFYSQPTNKDGLSMTCKECKGSRFYKNDFIICCKCKIEYPATQEYFTPKKGTRLGLMTTCKKCNAKLCKPRTQKVRIENREVWLEYRREYMECHKPEKSKSDKKYRNTINGKIRKKISDEKRRTLKKNLPCTLTYDEWIFCLKYFTQQDNKIHCAYCGCVLDNPTQDHFIPVSKKGGYTQDNILPSCQSCNSSKSNKDFEIWYKQQEFYDKQQEIYICEYLNQVKINKIKNK